VDGRAIHTRTLAGEVAGALGQEGIALIGRDTVSPTLTAPIRANLAIRVTRVREELAVEFDPIPFQTVLVADPAMEIDNRRLVQEGQVGLTKRRYRIVYHDDQEVSRTLEDAWAEQSAVTKTLAYGTKIVVRTLETPTGRSSIGAKCGCIPRRTPLPRRQARNDPRYGYTRLGGRRSRAWWPPTQRSSRCGRGSISLGMALAPLPTRAEASRASSSTCALMRASTNRGNWWSDVYLLTPVPPASQIRWILPDWPKYPDRRR